jgi:hypothetical protein
MSVAITVETPAMVEIDITNRGSTVGPPGPVTEAALLAVGGVTRTGTLTLTNKTLALGSNTVSGTLAQFNSAVSDADLASLAGTETLTNKTLQGVTLTDGFTEESYSALGNTAFTVSLSNGSIQTITLNSATACVLTVPAVSAGKGFLLCVKWSLATGSITWPATVKWPAGTAPTLTKVVGKCDRFYFCCDDGVNWYGQTMGLNYTV